MQSILTISPTKGAPSEASRGNSVAKLDGDLDTHESKNEAFKGFAEVLGSFTDKKQQLSDIKRLNVETAADTTGDIAEKSTEVKKTDASSANVKLIEADESVSAEDSSQLSEAANLPKKTSSAQQNDSPSFNNEEISHQQASFGQSPLDKAVTKKEDQGNDSRSLSQNIEMKPLEKGANSDSGLEIEGSAAKVTLNKEIIPSDNEVDISLKVSDSEVPSKTDNRENLDTLKTALTDEVVTSVKEIVSETPDKKVTSSDNKENLDTLKTAFTDEIVPSVKEIVSETPDKKVTSSDNKENLDTLKTAFTDQVVPSVKEIESEVYNKAIVSPDKELDAEVLNATPNNEVVHSVQEENVETPKRMSNNDSSFSDKEFDHDSYKIASSNEAILPGEKLDAETFNVTPNKSVVSSVNELASGAVKKEFNEEMDLPVKEPVQSNIEESSPLPETLSPILVQIETAQKVDTKVNDLKTKPNFVKEEISLKGSKDSSLFLDKGAKIGVDNLSTEEGVIDDKSIKELSSQPNKIDSIISSLKQEADKPIFGLNHDTHSMRATAATVSDRILNQSAANTPLMQSAALQQPIELQSKQASVIMGERIMMMLGQGKQEVTIRLDPAELGSMQIKLHVQQDQLQVAIQTQVGQSRDIIEQNLPRLREQLAQQGIHLGEASVEQQSRQQGQSESQHSQNNANALQTNSGRGEHLLDEQSEWLATQIPLPAQGIDYYA